MEKNFATSVIVLFILVLFIQTLIIKINFYSIVEYIRDKVNWIRDRRG